MSRFSDRFGPKKTKIARQLATAQAEAEDLREEIELNRKEILSGAPGLDHGGVVALKAKYEGNQNDLAKKEREVGRLKDKRDTEEAKAVK